MWDMVEPQVNPLSHDMPCTGCGHPTHTYLPCSDGCDCAPSWLALDESLWTHRGSLQTQVA
jgi:hypothetical protein